MSNLVRPALALGIVSLALGCSGKGGDPAITAAAIQIHTSVLGHDSMAGRGTGQPGYQQAADYVAAQLRRIGTEPGVSGSYFQQVPLRETTLERAAVAVTRGGRTQALTELTDFIVLGSQRKVADTAAGSVVFVGYGVSAPGLGHDDYAGVDVKGKIVAVLWGGPPSLPPNPRAHLSGGEKAKAAAARGAIGMVTLWTPEAEGVLPWAVAQRLYRAPSMTWLDAPGSVPDEVPELTSAMLSPTASEALFAGTPGGFQGVVAAAREGKSRAITLPAAVRIERTSRQRELTAPNVIGVVRGTDPKLRDEYVVFTAHLDHDGIAMPMAGDSIYNGVIDNAAAVAALLEVAESFAAGPKPKRSLVFVATAAEEKGLLGAYYFAAHPTVPAEAIVANLNMDGNHLLFQPANIVALGAEHSTLAGAAEEAARAEGLELETNLMPEQAFFIRSDQYPFVKKGIPALFFVNGTKSRDSSISGEALLGRYLTTVYHTPKDDLEQQIDWEAGAIYARVVQRIGRLVADADARPTWNPGDFFGETFGKKTVGGM